MKCIMLSTVLLCIGCTVTKKVELINYERNPTRYTFSRDFQSVLNASFSIADTISKYRITNQYPYVLVDKSIDNMIIASKEVVTIRDSIDYAIDLYDCLCYPDTLTSRSELFVRQLRELLQTPRTRILYIPDPYLRHYYDSTLDVSIYSPVGRAYHYKFKDSDIRPFYSACFVLNLKQVGIDSTEVSVSTLRPHVFIGKKYDYVAHASTFTFPIIKIVEPSTIEEYELLLRLGKKLGISDQMPPIIYPDFSKKK